MVAKFLGSIVASSGLKLGLTASFRGLTFYLEMLSIKLLLNRIFSLLVTVIVYFY